jgi:hypothetical protein
MAMGKAAAHRDGKAGSQRQIFLAGQWLKKKLFCGIIPDNENLVAARPLQKKLFWEALLKKQKNCWPQCFCKLRSIAENEKLLAARPLQKKEHKTEKHKFAGCCKGSRFEKHC